MEDFDAVFGLNVRALFVAQAVARRLVEAEAPGSIINISSQMGHVGGPSRTVYNATQSRGGRLHQGDGDRARAARHPRQHDLPDLHRDADDAALFRRSGFRDEVLAKITIGRLGQVEDLGAVLFLASDASALMTGTALMVDGGWTAE